MWEQIFNILPKSFYIFYFLTFSLQGVYTEFDYKVAQYDPCTSNEKKRLLLYRMFLGQLSLGTALLGGNSKNH